MEIHRFLFEQKAIIENLKGTGNPNLSPPNQETGDFIDILNEASSIFDSFIYGKDNDYLEIDIMCQNMIQTKFKKYKRFQETRFTPLCNRIDKLKNHLLEAREEIQDKLDKLHQSHQKVKEKIEQNNEATFSVFKSELNEEEKEMKENIVLAYENFDEFLGNQLEALSTSYKKQLSDAEENNAQLQLDLQSHIHDKHNLKQKLQSEIEEENKRFAITHEKVTRADREKKEEIQSKLNFVSEQIQSTHELMRTTGKEKSHLIEKLEKETIDRHNAFLVEQREKVIKIRKEEKEMTTKMKELSLSKQKIKLRNDSEITKSSQELPVQCQKINNNASKKIQSIEETAKKRYEPQLNELSSEIKKCKSQRSQLAIQNRDNVDLQNKENQEELVKLNHNHIIELENLNTTLNDRKNSLEEMKVHKKDDLNQLKSEMTQNIGSIMHTVDVKTNKVALEIVEIMKLFDGQQRILTNLQHENFQKKNIKRMKMIAKLKEEHENRKNEIIRNFDEMKEKEVEAKYEEEKEEENQQHENSLKPLQQRIFESKGKMEVLQIKIDGFIKIQEERINEFKSRMPDLFNDQEVPQITKSESEPINQIENDQIEGENGQIKVKSAKKPSELVDEIERKKKFVIEEVSELKEQLDTLYSVFDVKMKRIEDTYSKNKASLNVEQQNAERRYAQLQNKMSQQHHQIQQLDRIATVKTNEANKFEETFEEQKNQFESETRSNYQAEIQQIQKPVVDFDKQMIELRESFQDKIQTLQNQLEEAKRYTETLTSSLLKGREARIDSIQNQLTEQHEGQMIIIDKKHQLRMETVESERRQFKETCEEDIERIHIEFQTEMENTHNNTEQKIQELNNEKEDLTQESEVLDEEIEVVKSQECPECTRKKETIALMLIRKETLEKKLGILKEESIKMESPMNQIFGAKKRTISQPPILNHVTFGTSNLMTSRTSSFQVPINKRPLTTIRVIRDKQPLLSKSLNNNRPKTSKVIPIVPKVISMTLAPHPKDV